MRIAALLGVLSPLAIISAPSVGGLIAICFGGWRVIFQFLALWGVGHSPSGLVADCV
jgi:MFS family permease